MLRNRLIYVYFVQDDSTCETERKGHSPKHMAKHPKTTAATRVFKNKNTQHSKYTIHSSSRQGLGGLCYTQNVTHRADGEIFLLGSLMSGKSPSNSPPFMTSHKPSSMLMSPGNGCSSGLSAMTRPNHSPVSTKLEVASHLRAWALCTTPSSPLGCPRLLCTGRTTTPWVCHGIDLQKP